MCERRELCASDFYLSYLPGVVAVSAAALQLQFSVPALKTAQLAPHLLHLGANTNVAAATVQQLL